MNVRLSTVEDGLKVWFQRPKFALPPPPKERQLFIPSVEVFVKFIDPLTPDVKLNCHPIGIGPTIKYPVQIGILGNG